VPFHVHVTLPKSNQHNAIDINNDELLKIIWEEERMRKIKRQGRGDEILFNLILNLHFLHHYAYLFLIFSKWNLSFFSCSWGSSMSPLIFSKWNLSFFRVHGVLVCHLSRLTSKWLWWLWVFLQACKEFASSPTQWILSLLWMLFFIQQQLRQHQEGLFLCIRSEWTFQEQC